jgi:phosphatidylinositol glycan class N
MMAQFGRYRFLLIAVVFHLLYIWSCFSTYFTSPIVHGMREHRVETQEAPAKRLVLFVGESH